MEYYEKKEIMILVMLLLRITSPANAPGILETLLFIAMA